MSWCRTAQSSETACRLPEGLEWHFCEDCTQAYLLSELSTWETEQRDGNVKWLWQWRNSSANVAMCRKSAVRTSRPAAQKTVRQ